MRTVRMVRMDGSGEGIASVVCPGILMHYAYDAANRLTNVGGVTYTYLCVHK
jgi:hypothetical protein